MKRSSVERYLLGPRNLPLSEKAGRAWSSYRLPGYPPGPPERQAGMLQLSHPWATDQMQIKIPGESTLPQPGTSTSSWTHLLLQRYLKSARNFLIEPQSGCWPG